MFNARSNGVPRLVAYGDSVAMSTASGGHTGIMTGTSIAIGVASAAYAWSFMPTMSAHDVVQTMYKQGQKLDRGSNAALESFAIAAITKKPQPIAEAFLFARS